MIDIEPKEFAEKVKEWIDAKNGTEVEIIDIAEVSTLGDYFVIASGNSERQVKAIADNVEYEAEKLGIVPKSCLLYTSGFIVPIMAVFYFVAGILVIIINFHNVPAGIVEIFRMAFSPQAVAGGVGGSIIASMLSAMRWGVARGVFSNEAGLGSAPIAAAAAKTDHPSRQGYINMTGTFFDTLVVCTITGLVIASSGVLGMTDAAGEIYTGANLTIRAFESAIGPVGRCV